jgi:hypothetical protein
MGMPACPCFALLCNLHVQVRFTPTVEHCSMATLIGLCIRVKLLRALPPRFKVRTQMPNNTALLHGTAAAGAFCFADQLAGVCHLAC